MKELTLDIGTAIGRGWKQYIREIVPLTVQSIIMTLLGLVTLGILFPVLGAGFLKSVLQNFREGRTPLIEDVFGCFDRFWTLLWAFCLMLLCITLGFILIVPGIYLSVIWMYTFMVILDNPGISAIEAMKKSSLLVRTHSFWAHFVGMLIVTVILSVVAVIPLAVFLATPFVLVCMAHMYLQCRELDAAAQTTEPPKQITDPTPSSPFDLWKR
jgi:hypothetical protein